MELFLILVIASFTNPMRDKREIGASVVLSFTYNILSCQYVTHIAPVCKVIGPQWEGDYGR